MKEMIGTILLATVCFLMACLNLWNIFKDWFDKKYEPRKEDKSIKEHPQTKEPVPDIIGKSKFQLKKQEPPSREEPVKKEITELKEWFPQESGKAEEDDPFMSIPMETEESIRDDSMSLEDEDIPVMTEKEHSPFSTGTTIDEFELVVRALQGKQITEEEEMQVGYIIPKIEGTDIYNQFTKLIPGAEERSTAILNRIEDNRQIAVGNGDGGFDFRKYIRD